MNELAKLCEKYSTDNNDSKYITDKNTAHSYIDDVYGHVFESYKDKEINLLEIGVAYGGSIKLFNDYFTKGHIYGIDPFWDDPTTESWGHGNTPKEVSKDLIENPPEGVTIIVDDAYQEEVASNLPKFDIIIADGPHTPESQSRCVEVYLPKLKKEGVLLIEDINVEWHIETEDLENQSTISKILSNVPSDRYEYKIHDLRKNVMGRTHLGTEPSRGRSDNIILEIRNRM